MKNNSCMIKGGTNMNRQDFYDGKLFDAYRYRWPDRKSVV